MLCSLLELVLYAVSHSQMEELGLQEPGHGPARHHLSHSSVQGGSGRAAPSCPVLESFA